MSLLPDKFNIIENNVDNISIEILGGLINNYFENIFHSDEKVIHPDLISQIFWFNKDYNYNQVLINQLGTFLKERKANIRNNIKKGNFELEHLVKLIQNYNNKVTKFSSLITDKNNILKISNGQLFEMILSDPTTINFLKGELGNISKENKKNYVDLFNIVSEISNYNSELKCYQWFLFLISSCLKNSSEEISNKTYPVPEQYQNITNLISLFGYFNEIINFFTFVKTDSNIIYSNSLNILCPLIKTVFEISSIKQITAVFKSNQEIINKIISIPGLTWNDKSIKDFLSIQFINFLDIKLSKITNFTILKDIVECFDVFDKLLNNNSARVLINNKMTSFFNSDKTQNILLETINQCILNGITKENESLSKIIGFCNNIKDKDRFIAKYNHKLIERLLFKPNIELEKIYCNNMVEKFYEKLMVKTIKIINDVENTIKDRENFDKIELPSWYKKEKMNIVTTSYNNWDINQNEGIVTSDLLSGNNLLEKHMLLYDKFYSIRYEKRRLINWFPHFGEVIFDYKGKEIKMMPIQFMIIEFVSNKKNIDKETLLKSNFLKNYNDDFRHSLISSLIFGGILKMKNNLIEVNDNIDSINNDFINIFFSTTNYGDIWDKKREDELILSREEILSANINHYAKVKPIDKDDLYKIIEENLNVFTLDKEFYEKVLLSMIEKDYIKIEGTKVEKLLW